MTRVPHPLPAYLLTVMMRSSKTLIVEGRDDVMTMERLRVELEKGKPTISRHVKNRIAIDTPDMVSDPSLTSLGNRDRVIKIMQFCADNGNIILLDKVRAIVDAEWSALARFLDSVEYQADEINKVSYTFGHSVENYIGALGYFVEYLEQNWPEAVVPGFNEELLRYASECYRVSLCFSVATKRTHCLSRARSLITYCHFARDGSENISLRIEDVTAALLARGLDENQLRSLSLNYHEAIREFTGHDFHFIGRWGSDGHMLLDIMWGYTLFVLNSISGNVELIERISKSDKNLRFRFLVDRFASEVGCEKRPLDAIMKWALGEN